MFIGREREVAALDRLYESNKFEFAVIYGRRRVGKTALINHFIDNKEAIYFMGVESNEKQNLENFSKSIIEYSSGIEAETSFLSFQAVFSDLQPTPLLAWRFVPMFRHLWLELNAYPMNLSDIFEICLCWQ